MSSLAVPTSAAEPPPLLRAQGLTKHYPVRRGLLQRRAGTVKALDGVDLSLATGESFAVVGESGCGKTTLGRCLVRLIEPTAGEIFFEGKDLLALKGAELRRKRRHFQMIFQDPYGSLNPRMRVKTLLREPLEIHRVVPRPEIPARIAGLLEQVGLPASAAERFPHEFSGGQRQRIVIARALAPEPRLLVADEPVSALDVSVRAQILNLLSDLQARLGLTQLFIGHDLALVEQVADRIGVLYLGKLVEVADRRPFFHQPLHPYSVSLLSAAPVPRVPPSEAAVAQGASAGRSRILLPGDPPSPLDPPSGCSFHPRCPIARDHCRVEVPALAPVGDGERSVACHFPGELELPNPPV